MASEIADLYPEFIHNYLDGIAAACDPIVLEKALAAYTPHDVVIAWSLGSLALHRYLDSQPDFQLCCPATLLSLCPIFDFTRSHPDSPAFLRAMQRKLRTDPEQTLRDFWEAASRETYLADGFASLCQRRMADLDAARLSLGLDFLRDTRVDREKLLRRPERLIFLASPSDPISPSPFKREEISARIAFYGEGHIPFLTEPDRILELLAHP